MPRPETSTDSAKKNQSASSLQDSTLQAHAKVNPARASSRRGCLGVYFVFILIWLAGVWILWHAAMNATDKDPEEKSEPFHFIQPSDEKSSVEETNKDD